MPPSAAISSLSRPYTMRWRAGCIFDLNSSDVMNTLCLSVDSAVERKVLDCDYTGNVSPVMYCLSWLCGERACESR
jgi:hypothetical protein